MAIQVICPGCHARFKVSDQFGGKKGPCPKCKAIIQVPSADEKVVIHEPEHSEPGARGASGQLALKPIERTETAIQPTLVAGVTGIAILVLLVAFILRFSDKSSTFIQVVLFAGAITLAPPLCWGGYALMRNDEELEPYTGKSLWIRTAICSAVYAILWWAFGYFYQLYFGSSAIEVWTIVLLAWPFLLVGTATAYCCYELEPAASFFHYGLYLFVTILLRMAMGLPPVGPTGSP